MKQSGDNPTAGQRAAVIAGVMGLLPALGLGVLRFVSKELPEISGQILGNLTFTLVLASPYLAALAVSRTSRPEFRGAILLVMAVLLPASFFLVPSPVALFLPATIALFIAAVRSLRGAGRKAVLAPLFLVPGLAMASAIGFSFYALFQVQEDEPRCWVLRLVEGREEWQSMEVPERSESGGMRMGPFGPGVQRASCTSDIITNQEAYLGLGVLGAGFLVVMAALWLPTVVRLRTVTADSPGSRGFLLGRLAGLTIVVVALGLTVLVAWSLKESIVWRSEVSVVGAKLHSPTKLILSVDSCNGDPQVSQLRETDREVQVKVIASSTPFLGGGACLDGVEVQLQAPLGDRLVVDRHSGQSVSVTKVNSSSD